MLSRRQQSRPFLFLSSLVFLLLLTLSGCNQDIDASSNPDSDPLNQDGTDNQTTNNDSDPSSDTQEQDNADGQQANGDNDSPNTPDSDSSITNNQPPKAMISAPQTSISGQTVTLNGAGSSDPDGGILSYNWIQTKGPVFALSDSTSSTLTFVAPMVSQATQFTFQLTVHDGELSDTETVSVQISSMDDNKSPSIVSRSPQPDQRRVSTNAEISVGFDEALLETSVDSLSFSVSQNGNPASGVVSYDSANKTITIKPASPLSPDTTYTITLTSTIEDLAGNAFEGESWSFTTASDTVADGLCATAEEGNSLMLSCPSGQVISEVLFASYGTPGSLCGSFTTGTCHAGNSESVVSEACKGRNSCTLNAGSDTFGDPCESTVKKLAAQVACGTANTNPTPNPSTGADRDPLAFPGAEGFGRYTSGGRGGEVYHVTNLNDSGPGSFRDAVSQPNRIVVFDVGGVINITDRIVIHRNIYVAGQTAPGGGITIYGNGIALNGDSGNDIIRYIRIRMGKNGDSGKDALGISAGQDYMFDHVSISWGRDGTLDVNGTGIDNLTFQDSIVSQGINNANHSTGGLMQSGKWSMIRSLYIDNKTRNPKARGTHEFINNVLYNWASNGYIMGDTSGVSECNLIGNYFIYGPSSSSNSHITRTTPTFYVYPEDNWVDSDKNGTLDGSLMTDYKTATVMESPFNYPGVKNQLSAQDALSHVINNVGASLVRDAVDELLIKQILSYGIDGQIINTEVDNGISANVGAVANGIAPKDSDRDGMPDEWEVARGLNPGSADDADDDDGDGYTNIEEYLSCIVGEGDC